jgi:hypothetical protein
MSRWRLTILGLGVLIGFNLPVAATPTDRQIERCIEQLGSVKFAERRAASEALKSIGAPALEALRQATHSEDAEVRSRAEDLVRAIEKRIEVDRILQPTRIDLNYHNTPVLDAVKHLAWCSGCPIVIREADRPKLARRKITLQTPELPFWEALDKFCVQAGLSHALTAAPRLAIQTQSSLEREAARRASVADASPGQIVLIDDKSQAPPTSYAGALRVRAAAAERIASREAEAIVTLEIAAEPKLQWRDLLDVRVATALDAKGRSLTQVPLETLSTAWLDEGVPLIVGNVGGGRRGFAGQIEVTNSIRPRTGSFLHHAPIRLQLQDSTKTTLQSLKGVLVAEVQAPSEPLVVVEDVLAAAGKVVQGKDGFQVKVQDVKKLSNGDVQVEVIVAAGPMGLAGNNIVVQAGNPRIRNGQIQIRFNGPGNGGIGLDPTFSGVEPGTRGLTLHDADGQAYQVISRLERSVILVNNVVTQREERLTFRPRSPDAVPKKLTYAASRATTIEIPFDLQDVPLP